MCPTPAASDSAPDAVTYTVPDMTCGHCKAAVADAISAISGVESVDVDLDTKRVVVEGPGFTDEAVRTAVGDAGYEVSSA